MKLSDEAARRAGCIQLRRARQTGTVVGVYQGAEAGIDNDPSHPWVTLCEKHDTLVTHPTRALALAHAPYPHEWCDECQQEGDGS